MATKKQPAQPVKVVHIHSITDNIKILNEKLNFIVEAQEEYSSRIEATLEAARAREKKLTDRIAALERHVG
jgi:hypothetical protein